MGEGGKRVVAVDPTTDDIPTLILPLPIAATAAEESCATRARWLSIAASSLSSNALLVAPPPSPPPPTDEVDDEEERSTSLSLSLLMA